MDGHTAGDTTVLQRLWQNIRLTWRLVFLCRFSAFVVLVFGLGFLLVDQIQDLLMALDSASVLFGRQWLFLYVAVWAAAVSSWYWARVLLSFDFPQAPPLAGFLIFVNRQLPRVLGALMFAFVAAALLRAALNFSEAPDSFQRLMLGAAAIAGQGVLFYIFVLHRRRWLKALDKRLERQRRGRVHRLPARRHRYLRCARGSAPCELARAWREHEGDAGPIAADRSRLVSHRARTSGGPRRLFRRRGCCPDGGRQSDPGRQPARLLVEPAAAACAFCGHRLGRGRQLLQRQSWRPSTRRWHGRCRLA